MTFEDLKFKQDKMGTWRCRHNINNYEISVVAGEFVYSTPKTNLDNPHDFSGYEIAIFKDGDFTRDFFDSDHYDDVMGYVTKKQIISLIRKIKKS
jgi:hypothetical protein|tara:strand:+ start:263 stop:547 length:285 start_codon:yes stop_codon:yes gene_type:complete